LKYINRPEFCLPLSIPLEATVNKAEVAAWEQKRLETNDKE